MISFCYNWFVKKTHNKGEWGMRNIIVVDLGFGDSGKGTITDAIVRQYGAKTVVRYNGGAQAAHRVVAPDGRTHVFNQFGSGTLVDGTKTFLSRFMLVNPLAMIYEEKKLCEIGITDAFNRMYIDQDALITTPYHMYANRVIEYSRGQNRHGSCGMGIGQTMADSESYPDKVLIAKDLLNSNTLKEKMTWYRNLKLQELKDTIEQIDNDPDATEQIKQTIQNMRSEKELTDAITVYSYLASMVNIVSNYFLINKMAEEDVIVFEGAQGVLLDQNRGFFPYCTRSTTTTDNALTLIGETKIEQEIITIGCIRAYATRHGAGPFVTEDKELTKVLPDSNNIFNTWQHDFRTGWLDTVATRYAIDVCEKIDYLAVTNLDRFLNINDWKICNSYTYTGEDIDIYFNGDGCTVRDIKNSASTNLSYQTELTNRINTCIPCYESISSIDEYMEAIQKQLNVPIGITSYGVSFDDKEFNIPTKNILTHAKI